LDTDKICLSTNPLTGIDADSAPSLERNEWRGGKWYDLEKILQVIYAEALKKNGEDPGEDDPIISLIAEFLDKTYHKSKHIISYKYKDKLKSSTPINDDIFHLKAGGCVNCFITDGEVNEELWWDSNYQLSLDDKDEHTYEDSKCTKCGHDCRHSAKNTEGLSYIYQNENNHKCIACNSSKPHDSKDMGVIKTTVDPSVGWIDDDYNHRPN
jgi:hypothetical protein